MQRDFFQQLNIDGWLKIDENEVIDGGQDVMLHTNAVLTLRNDCDVRRIQQVIKLEWEISYIVFLKLSVTYVLLF